MTTDLIDRINEVESFTRISEFMDDDDVNTALAYLIEFIANPQVNQQVAPILIVKLTAIAMKLKLIGKDYMILTKAGTDAAKKKNMYLSLSEAMMEVVGSLKYIARS